MGAAFGSLPPTAAWQHVDARDGFEVVFLQTRDVGYQLVGCTTAVEDGKAWAVRYEILVDDAWRTRAAYVSSRSASGDHEVQLEADGSGHWRIGGVDAPHMDGCFDIDLEASSCTNTLPVHRLGLGVGQGAAAPAAYVRALGVDVERLEQRYVRIEDDGTRRQFDYTAPVFDYRGLLVYDASGLVLDHPGIAIRAI
ncbi:MAG TPA: putative glycolipid-binding domain-containing protein [Mycobacterium sp.]|nr:putative glycolipid-binding domain-containing protein [Mycobacterium sp.]